MTNEGRTILLVDDEELNTDMLSRRLIRSGFVVEVASNGADALAKIQSCAIDLVLLDQMMPQMSGREVLERIRKDLKNNSLPVIMVTAVAESERIAEALEAGANDYVTKPIDYKVALARINLQLSRRSVERALRTSEERYALAARASRDAIWDWDLQSEAIYFSPRWVEMVGLSPDEVTNSPDCWFSRVFASDRPALLKCIDDGINGLSDTVDCSYRIHHGKEEIRWMSTRAVVTKDEQGRAIRLSGSQSDVTEEKTRDALTGLLNRVALKSELERLYQAAEGRERGNSPSYSLLFMDLDGFKAVNDSLGHLAGDQLLSNVAARLSLVIAEFATQVADDGCSKIQAARLGGDEFAILLQSTSAAAHGDALALRVQQAMRPPAILDGRSIHIALSIGVASHSPRHDHYDELLFDADLAMYAAKKVGRGTTATFSPEMRRATLDKLNLENELRTALGAGQLHLLYQPKVRLETGVCYGAEALIRWNHPTRGPVGPTEFIPIAEETGLIVEIGRWVLRTACLQILEWHRDYPSIPPLELSVNLSPSEFKQEGLIEQIAATLESTGFPASSLHLEITEGVLFEDLAEAREKLLALRNLGVLLDLDDFGSGYSSLRYLSELPFDTLKIDRYFISSLDSNATISSAGLIETILAMASTLGLKVVAEGVETLPHAVLLKDLGCEFAQGYYFSRPVTPAAMNEILVRTCAKAAAREALETSESVSDRQSTFLGTGA